MELGKGPFVDYCPEAYVGSMLVCKRVTRSGHLQKQDSKTLNSKAPKHTGFLLAKLEKAERPRAFYFAGPSGEGPGNPPIS